MKEPKLSRESQRAMAKRFCENVARLMEERGMKKSEMGKVVDPGNKNPSSVAFILLHRHTLPDDKTICAVASALGVATESLHTGELEQFKGSKIEQIKGVTGREASVKTRAASTRVAREATTRQAVPEDDGTEVLYGLVMDMLKVRVMALEARAEFMEDLAKLCRGYGL